MIQKQVVQLDENGYFVGVTMADESPLEPGVFLLPAGSIDTLPPASVPYGKRAKWTGSGFAIEDIPRPPQPEIAAGFILEWNEEKWDWEVKPAPIPEPPPPPPPPPPLTQEELDAMWLANAEVTMRQARLALLGAGLLDQVEAAITRPEDRIEWEYATTVRRQSPLVQSLTTSLALTEKQVNDLFFQAKDL